MSVKKDCFAWNGNGCSRLLDTYCEKENCSFYLCTEEYIAKTNEAYERLKADGWLSKSKEDKLC